MQATYLNTGQGNLVLIADDSDRAALRELRGPVGPYGETKRSYLEIEADALEGLICNSELEWVRPEEIGALTSAPIIGLRDEEGKPTAAWGFMDYALRSFVDDLIDTGRATFVSES